VTATEETTMSDRDYLYGHVCVHGSLALSCEMCDLEDFLDEVQEAWTRAEAENARLRAERAVMLDVIEAADEYATWGGKENRKILFDALARARDLARRRT